MNDSLSSAQASGSTPTSQVASEEFFIDWENASIATLRKDGSRSASKGDFAIKLTALVEAGSNTGYLALVKRRIDMVEKECFFTAESALNKSRFLSQINNSYGSGGMSLSLNESQFALFVQHLKNSGEQPLSIKKATTVIGLQDCGTVWVFGSDIQIRSDGTLMDASDSSGYYWLPKNVLGEVGNMSPSKLVPRISTPLNIAPISQLVSLLKSTMKHKFVSSMLVLSGGIMALHYEKIREVFGGCPVIVAIGKPETGKSTTMKAVAALYGLMDNGMHGKMTPALVHERSSMSSIPFVIDDPPKSSSRYNTVDINDIIVDSYNGLMSGNMKTGCTRPVSSAMVSTNYDIKSDARISTRAVLVQFSEPTISLGTEEDDAIFEQLERLFRSGELSRVIGWIVSLGCGIITSRKSVSAYKAALRGTLSGRKLQNWAILLHFTQQVLECVKGTGVDTGLDMTNFTAFVRNPGITTDACEIVPSDIVKKTIEEFVLACEEKSLAEINVFAHTTSEEKRGGKKERVLSIVLQDIAPSFSHSCDVITDTLIANGFGVRSSKDFLVPGYTGADKTIRRGHNSHKRRCLSIYLSKLEDDVRQKIIDVTTKEKDEQILHWEDWEAELEDALPNDGAGENSGGAGIQQENGDNEGDAGKKEHYGKNEGDAGKKKDSDDNEGEAGKKEDNNDNEGDAGKKEDYGENEGDAGKKEDSDNNEGDAGKKEDNDDNEGDDGKKEDYGENEGDAGKTLGRKRTMVRTKEMLGRKRTLV